MKLLKSKTEKVDIDSLNTIEEADKALRNQKRVLSEKRSDAERADRKSYKYYYFGDDGFFGFTTGGIISVVGGFFTYFHRVNFNIFEIDVIKNYFVEHPESLAYVEEKLGSTDLDYIAGYVMGEDGLAQALYVGCGLRDFFIDTAVDSAINAGIGGCIGFTLPTIAFFARKYYNKSKLKTISKEIEKLENEKKQIEEKRNELLAERQC